MWGNNFNRGGSPSGNPMSNMVNMLQRFNQFKQQFQNQDPEKMVQQLLDSGKMSQDQYKQFREMANSILGTKY